MLRDMGLGFIADSSSVKNIIIWVLIAAALSVVVEVVTERRRGSSVVWGELLPNVLRNSLIVGMLVLLIQTAGYVTEIRAALVVPGQSDVFSRVEKSLTQIGRSNLFARIAESRVEEILGEMNRIAKGEVFLRNGEEVTDVWGNLITQASNSVKATNVIAPSFWREAKHMGDEARAAHAAAIANGLRVSRLYILNFEEPENVEAVRELSAEYDAIGVENRFVDLGDLESIEEYSDCQQQLSAIDFVIFDESVVLLVTHSASFEVLSGRLSRRREEHVDRAVRCFEDWWNSTAVLRTLPTRNRLTD